MKIGNPIKPIVNLKSNKTFSLNLSDGIAGKVASRLDIDIFNRFYNDWAAWNKSGYLAMGNELMYTLMK